MLQVINNSIRFTINLFQANVLFLYTLKTSENLWFEDFGVKRVNPFRSNVPMYFNALQYNAATSIPPTITIKPLILLSGGDRT